MCGHRNVYKTATFVGEDHEDEQQAIGHGRDDEEVGGRDLRDSREGPANSLMLVAAGETCTSPTVA